MIQCKLTHTPISWEKTYELLHSFAEKSNSVSCSRDILKFIHSRKATKIWRNLPVYFDNVYPLLLLCKWLINRVINVFFSSKTFWFVKKNAGFVPRENILWAVLLKPSPNFFILNYGDNDKFVITSDKRLGLKTSEKECKTKILEEISSKNSNIKANKTRGSLESKKCLFFVELYCCCSARSAT